MFSVVITMRGGESTTRDFDQPVVSIGRGRDNDIVLPRSSVESQHARIELKQGQLFVLDLDSSNGTCVNGRKIKPAKAVGVAVGDTISVGDVELRIAPTSEVPARRPDTSHAPSPRSALLSCGNCNGPLEQVGPAHPAITCAWCGYQTKNPLHEPR